MEIRLSGIVPVPIPEKDVLQSEVWNRDVAFNTSDKLLIYAESGKGKTTLINILFGKRKDYSGSLYINNRDIKSFSLNEMSQLRKDTFSIVPQGLSLFSDLTLIENIEIKNKIQNFYPREKILKMLEILGLSGFENRKAQVLSFGQRQRVAIIRALCQSFKFLLLDEAFSHIDSKNAEIAWNLIKNEVEKQKAGIILTSLQDYPETNFQKLRV